MSLDLNPASSSGEPEDTQSAEQQLLCPGKTAKTKCFVNRSQKNLDQADYDTMTREQLVDECIRLQRHSNQLKNILSKTNASDKCVGKRFKPKKPWRERPFDFNKFNKRHVFIKFLYLGWNYEGYITQEHTTNTIEHHLFEALKMTKLIESRETSNYHRCGRTDIGVSAFSQIASIDLRSNCASGTGVVVNEKSKVTNHDIKNEMNYVKMLNGALPDEIRAICWSPVEAEMSARFDCTGRVYRYYFPKGDLDIEAMNEAGQRMIGAHDFRNFCKMDVSNGVVTFFRKIMNVSCRILDTTSVTKYSTVELIIDATSFLWHQIRCIVGILFLVGQRREEPSIVTELFNVEKYPCKPQYSMAAEIPLVLFDCRYEGVKEWRFDHIELEKLLYVMQEQWVKQSMSATIVQRMMDYLEIEYTKSKSTYVPEDKPSGYKRKNLDQTYIYLQGHTQGQHGGNYVKLADRMASSSLEDRVDHYVKRRRLNPDIYDRVEANKKIVAQLDLYAKEADYGRSSKSEDDKKNLKESFEKVENKNEISDV